VQGPDITKKASLRGGFIAGATAHLCRLFIFLSSPGALACVGVPSGAFSLRIPLPTKTPLDANHKVRIAARSGAHIIHIHLSPWIRQSRPLTRSLAIDPACTHWLQRAPVWCPGGVIFGVPLQSILRILPSNVYEARSHHGTFRQAGAVPVWHFFSAANDVGVGRLRRFFRVWLLSFDFPTF
jgi:hypothetical protein